MPADANFDDLLRAKARALKKLDAANADIKRAEERRKAALDDLYAVDEAISFYIDRRTKSLD